MSIFQRNKNMVTRKTKQLHSLTKYVAFSIAIVLVYTVAEFIISTLTGVSHDTLTVALYGFFGGEITIAGLIKIFKLKGVRE